MWGDRSSRAHDPDAGVALGFDLHEDEIRHPATEYAHRSDLTLANSLHLRENRPSSPRKGRDLALHQSVVR